MKYAGNIIYTNIYLMPLQEPSTCTLSRFLIDNEGKRCVVVLDVGGIYCMDLFQTVIFLLPGD